MVDALASRADEGRGKTAKSPGVPSSRLIRGFPNGENCRGECPGTPQGEGTGGTETSKYPEEEITIPLVAASERGAAQTPGAQWVRALCLWGVVGQKGEAPGPS